MKKLNFIFIILLLLAILGGCNFQNSKYINFSTKPNNHYYTDKIKEKIINGDNFNLYVFDTNLYKEIEVPKTEISILDNFISSLTKENYSDETINLKEPFRFKITFADNDQYLIKIYNESLVSISPWDGTYKEDIVIMKNTPLRYNLFDFCNHILNNPISNETIKREAGDSMKETLQNNMNTFNKIP